jgi:hypothetical protein
MGASEEQHREDHPTAKLLFANSRHPDIPCFFYSTTLLTSYFHPLDWASIAF